MPTLKLKVKVPPHKAAAAKRDAAAEAAAASVLRTFAPTAMDQSRPPAASATNARPLIQAHRPSVATNATTQLPAETASIATTAAPTAASASHVSRGGATATSEASITTPSCAGGRSLTTSTTASSVLPPGAVYAASGTQHVARNVTAAGRAAAQGCSPDRMLPPPSRAPDNYTYVYNTALLRSESDASFQTAATSVTGHGTSSSINRKQQWQQKTKHKEKKKQQKKKQEHKQPAAKSSNTSDNQKKQQQKKKQEHKQPAAKSSNTSDNQKKKKIGTSSSQKDPGSNVNAPGTNGKVRILGGQSPFAIAASTKRSVSTVNSNATTTATATATETNTDINEEALLSEPLRTAIQANRSYQSLPLQSDSTRGTRRRRGNSKSQAQNIAIEPDDPWATVQIKLISQGWFLEQTDRSGKGVGIACYRFPFSKTKKEGGLEGIDYVTKEIDMKVLATKFFGWAGDEEVLGAMIRPGDGDAAVVGVATNLPPSITGVPSDHGKKKSATADIPLASLSGKKTAGRRGIEEKATTSQSPAASMSKGDAVPASAKSSKSNRRMSRGTKNRKARPLPTQAAKLAKVVASTSALASTVVPAADQSQVTTTNNAREIIASSNDTNRKSAVNNGKSAVSVVALSQANNSKHREITTKAAKLKISKLSSSSSSRSEALSKAASTATPTKNAKRKKSSAPATTLATPTAGVSTSESSTKRHKYNPTAQGPTLIESAAIVTPEYNGADAFTPGKAPENTSNAPRRRGGRTSKKSKSKEHINSGQDPLGPPQLYSFSPSSANNCRDKEDDLTAKAMQEEVQREIRRVEVGQATGWIPPRPHMATTNPQGDEEEAFASRKYASKLPSSSSVPAVISPPPDTSYNRPIGDIASLTSPSTATVPKANAASATIIADTHSIRRDGAIIAENRERQRKSALAKTVRAVAMQIVLDEQNAESASVGRSLRASTSRGLDGKSVNADNKEEKRGRRAYLCAMCEVPKKDHVCPFDLRVTRRLNVSPTQKTGRSSSRPARPLNKAKSSLTSADIAAEAEELQKQQHQSRLEIPTANTAKAPLTAADIAAEADELRKLQSKPVAPAANTLKKPLTAADITAPLALNIAQALTDVEAEKLWKQPANTAKKPLTAADIAEAENLRKQQQMERRMQQAREAAGYSLPPLRTVIIPRSDPKNPQSNFGIKLNTSKNGFVVISKEYPSQNLNKGDVIYAVNGVLVLSNSKLKLKDVVKLCRDTEKGKALELQLILPTETTKHLKNLHAEATAEFVQDPTSHQNKKKYTKKPLPPPRSTSERRNRKAPIPYSDDKPGTVTFEEEFGDGKGKGNGGEKRWIRDTETNEWIVVKINGDDVDTSHPMIEQSVAVQSATDLVKDGDGSAGKQPKRKRGRPRKIRRDNAGEDTSRLGVDESDPSQAITDLVKDGDNIPNQKEQKRKRGRPRKNPLVEDTSRSGVDESDPSQAVTDLVGDGDDTLNQKEQKRKRGRPRKVPLVPYSAPSTRSIADDAKAPGKMDAKESDTIEGSKLRRGPIALLPCKFPERGGAGMCSNQFAKIPMHAQRATRSSARSKDTSSSSDEEKVADEQGFAEQKNDNGDGENTEDIFYLRQGSPRLTISGHKKYFEKILSNVKVGGSTEPRRSPSHSTATEFAQGIDVGHSTEDQKTNTRKRASTSALYTDDNQQLTRKSPRTKEVAAPSQLLARSASKSSPTASVSKNTSKRKSGTSALYTDDNQQLTRKSPRTKEVAPPSQLLPNSASKSSPTASASRKTSKRKSGNDAVLNDKAKRTKTAASLSKSESECQHIDDSNIHSRIILERNKAQGEADELRIECNFYKMKAIQEEERNEEYAKMLERKTKQLEDSRYCHELTLREIRRFLPPMGKISGSEHKANVKHIHEMLDNVLEG